MLTQIAHYLDLIGVSLMCVVYALAFVRFVRWYRRVR